MMEQAVNEAGVCSLPATEPFVPFGVVSSLLSSGVMAGILLLSDSVVGTEPTLLVSSEEFSGLL